MPACALRPGMFGQGPETESADEKAKQPRSPTRADSHTSEPTPGEASTTSDPARAKQDEAEEKAESTEFDPAAAKNACRGCPLNLDCLAYTLTNPSATNTGVWAATLPNERRKIRQGVIDRLGRDDWDHIVLADYYRRHRGQQPRRSTTRPGAVLSPT